MATVSSRPPGGFQHAPGRCLVERGDHPAFGVQALVDLDHAVIERRRAGEVEGEDVRPGLVADHQQVCEAAGDHEEGARALAFEQCVGGDGRAHLDRADRGSGRQPPHAFARRVGIVRAFGQEFERVQPTVRRAADHVGEGTAPVDPEFPLIACLAGHRPSSVAAAPAEVKHGAGPRNRHKLALN